MQKKIVEVKNLKISFSQNKEKIDAVKDSSFSIFEGECLALVGESGSGKSVTALSIMNLLKENNQTSVEGKIFFLEKNLLKLSSEELFMIRGKRISMIFQEPMTSLNPLHTIRKQIKECLVNLNTTDEKIIELLTEVGIENPSERLDHYPHQLSGGQRQRIMIAMAIANNPKLLIADEPTTALDVTIQKQILDLLNKLRKKFKMSLLLITHDLSIVKKISERVCVMEKGIIVEENTTENIFKRPKHVYTKKLIDSEPKEKKFKNKSNETLLSVSSLNVFYKLNKGFFFSENKDKFHAVKDISFKLERGQTLGIVGESGSGKSSIAQALLKLIEFKGELKFKKEIISSLSESKFKPYRKNIQIIFQDPFSSLSPRLTVERIIGEGLEVHRKELNEIKKNEKIRELLKKVGLEVSMLNRYPHEFSGGQRQRIAIARALILEPELIILDEPTSALDMTVQSQIIELLLDLQKKFNLTYIFISHDLKVIKALSDNIIVMKSGKIIEFGETKLIFKSPKSQYTKELLTSAFI